MITNESLWEVVTGAYPTKETEISVIVGTHSYANCAIWWRNFAVLRNAVNSPVTYILQPLPQNFKNKNKNNQKWNVIFRKSFTYKVNFLPVNKVVGRQTYLSVSLFTGRVGPQVATPMMPLVNHRSHWTSSSLPPSWRCPSQTCSNVFTMKPTHLSARERLAFDWNVFLLRASPCVTVALSFCLSV